MDLYHNDMSVCSQKLRIVLSEKGLTPALHQLDLRAGAARAPGYLKLNPNRVVPTLVDQGVPISESTVICEYLDDAYPETPLRPIDPFERAAMKRWTMLPDTGLHLAAATVSVAIAFRHQDNARQIATFTGKKLERARALVSQGLDASFVSDQVLFYDSVVGKVAHQLDKTLWLAGDTYSLADIAIIPYICRLADLAQSWMWAQRSGRLSIGSWLERCKTRKGYAGISAFLNPDYLALMGKSGQEARPKVEQILKYAD